MAEQDSDLAVRDPGYGDATIQSLNLLRKDEQLCDFTIRAEDREFKVHRALLAAASDYFRVMFTGHMRESNENSVELKGMTADSLQQIIDFVYCGEIILNFDNLTEVLNAASHLQVNRALDLCCDFIQSKLNFENADELLQIADVYSLNKVTEHFDVHILDNFEAFSKTESFINLDAKKLIQYISSDALKISSEFRLYELVNQWLHHDKARFQHAEKIMSHIHFALMTQPQLQKAREDYLMRTNTRVTQYVIEGLKYGLDVCCRQPVINERSEIRTTKKSLVVIHQGSAFRPFQVTAFNHERGLFYKLFSNTSGSCDCRVAVIDNFIYICRIVDFGGGTLMNSLCRFDPRHLQVQELSPMKRLRLDSALVAIGHKLYVLGGGSENLFVLDSVECYDVNTNMWTDEIPLLEPTHSHAATVTDDKIYISGGVSSTDRQPVNTFASFDLTTRTWESKPGIFYARRLHDMVAIDRKIFVLGGITRHGVSNTGQTPIECYDIQTEQWTLLAHTFSGRSIGHYIAMEGKIYSIGREHYSAAEDEIWVYDLPTDQWSKLAKAPNHMNLSSAVCTKLFINFSDENVERLKI
ncbi:kelch-like protein 13 [Lingula anatina]|uniref:Kelch-like protein 13 n=1 Tax=Lingula anatina TaxID=7574 RepID=A0A1S3HQN2_LINAN|nr:kelch-like protein 13 [Lingula anatina]|eukprot:XP_013388363.1 kelch-like protein 13 [Lingula anatina]